MGPGTARQPAPPPWVGILGGQLPLSPVTRTRVDLVLMMPEVPQNPSDLTAGHGDGERLRIRTRDTAASPRCAGPFAAGLPRSDDVPSQSR
jgi:hypothetical protein